MLYCHFIGRPPNLLHKIRLAYSFFSPMIVFLLFPNAFLPPRAINYRYLTQAVQGNTWNGSSATRALSHTRSLVIKTKRILCSTSRCRTHLCVSSCTNWTLRPVYVHLSHYSDGTARGRAQEINPALRSTLPLGGVYNKDNAARQERRIWVPGTRSPPSRHCILCDSPLLSMRLWSSVGVGTKDLLQVTLIGIPLA